MRNNTGFPVSHARHQRQRHRVTFFLLLCVTSLCYADTPYSDQNNLFRSARYVGSLGAALFGDKVSLNDGTLEFIQHDVSLPGNSSLPVTVSRRMVTGQAAKDGHFGSWDLEIPHLHGVFSDQAGWRPVSGKAEERCSSFGSPVTVGGSFGSDSVWAGTEYWHGSFLYVPGKGDQELLRRTASNTIAPTSSAGYTYPIVTRQNWQIRCLPAMDPRNGSAGQAFAALSPDGTEYQFDWMAERPISSLTKSDPGPEMASGSGATLSATTGGASIGSGSMDSGTVSPMQYPGSILARKEVWILPTRITDRFGNTVTYTYDTINKWQLRTISATDASGSSRTITFTYVSPGSTTSHLVHSVSDGTRTWTYHYGQSWFTKRPLLQSVTLPDGATWQLGGLESLQRDIVYSGGGAGCEAPGTFDTTPLVASVTHPSGATGEFVLTPTRHGRTGVPKNCFWFIDSGDEVSYYPKLYDKHALTKKTISGPGLRTMEWVTTYPQAVSSWEPWDGHNGSKQVEVSDPDGHITRYTFGTVYMQSEGQLELTEQLDRDRNLLRSTRMRYVEAVPPYGESDQRRGNGDIAARVIENDKREIVQQGTSFIWEASQFNELAQPRHILRTSNLGTRFEDLTYENNKAKWILGQVKTVTEKSTGKTPTDNRYNAITANLEEVYSFGLFRKSMSYHPNGTLAGEKDGRNHETHYTNYKRGIPQNVTFANGSAISAIVNNLGGIDSVTNASGAKTSFGYDAMGRFSAIHYAGGDPVAWNATTISFNRSKGNAMLEPVGGKTVPAGKSGQDTHTLYPNGSNAQRLNEQGHPPNNSTPHGHGHKPGSGPGMKGQGPSTDPKGNIVKPNSSDAHWPIN